MIFHPLSHLGQRVFLLKDTVLNERNVHFISDTLIQMLDKSKEDNKNETV